MLQTLIPGRLREIRSLSLTLAVLLLFGISGFAHSQSILYLPLDEGAGQTATDLSGAGNNGLLIGSPTYDSDTPSGQGYALRFDGSDDLIELGGLDAASSGLTIAAWMKADSFPGRARDARIISKASGSATNDHVFMLSTLAASNKTRPRFRVRLGGITRTIKGGAGSDLVTGQWYHIAATYDGAAMRLYLDGVQVASRNVVGVIDLDPAMSAAVGAQPDGSKVWHGLIDDVRILQNSTPANEIGNLMISVPAITATADNYSLLEGETLTIDAPGVLANDTDPQGTALTAVFVSSASNGTLDLSATGAFIYTPDADFAGVDSFTYRASNGTDESSTAEVTLTVSAVNDAPVANADSYVAAPDQTLTVDAPGVLANDTDADSDSLTATLVPGSSNGSVELQPDGSFTYTPASGFSGADFFDYRAVDGAGQLSAETRVTITVNAPPLVADDDYSTDEDNALSIVTPGVLGNDSDSTGAGNLAAVIESEPVNGSVNLGSDGSFDYVPQADFAGVDSFVYSATDAGTGLAATATVTITVNAVNDAPVAVADAFTTDFETLLAASVIANDSDPENDSLSVTLVESTRSGSLNLAGEGTFTYQPNPGYSGVDSFTYLLSDGSLTAAIVTATITVADEGTPNVNPDLLVQLTMDDSQTPVTDSSGNGNNGVISGAVQYADETGDSSFKSLQFNGTNSSVNVGAVDVAGSGLTMAAWIKAESFPGGANDPRIISKASGTSTNEHIFMLGTVLSNGETRLRARVRVGNQTTTVIAPAGYGLETGQWYHVAAIYDGTNVKVFLNAEELASEPLSGPVDQDPGVDLAIGSQPGGGKHFDGLIDDVRVAAIAIPLAELQAIAQVEVTAVSGNGVYDSDTEVTYKEYWISHEWFTGLDDCADSPTGGKWFSEPYGEESACPMYFDIDDDISNALRAEVYMDIWRGRDTRSVRFNINGGETRRPDVGLDWSRTPYLGSIPLTELVPGTNVLNLWRGGGQFHVHDIAIRVYHNAEKPLLENGAPVAVPFANLVSIKDDNGVNSSPQTPGVLYIDDDKLTLTAYATRDAKFMEFHAYYDGYDEDNDGYTVDWHNRTRNNWHPGGRSPRGTGGTIDHIGTVLVGQAGNYTVHWSIPWMKAQSNVRFKVRVVDGDGNVRDAAGGTSAEFDLVRVTTNVQTFTIPDFEDAVLHAAGNAPATLDKTIDLPLDLSMYDEAILIASYWNNPRLSINGNTGFLAFNSGEDWPLSIKTFPVSYLTGGQNQLQYEHNSGYGEFIEKPGPMIVLKGPALEGPVAGGDSYTTPEGVTLSVGSPGVLANDTDPQGSTLSAVLVASTSNGTLGLSAAGAFSYTPAPGFVGTDSFTYRASNGTDESSIALVSLTVSEVNDAPVANADSYVVAPDQTASVDAPGVLANDTDPENDSLTAALVTGSSNGNVALQPDGAFTYTPDSGFSGTDFFDYRAVDGAGQPSTEVRVTISVSVPPVVLDDDYSTDEDNALSVAAPGLLSNDTDSNGTANLAAAIVSEPVNGSVTLGADGSFDYSPQADFAGVDSFLYSATDAGTSVAATAMVTITVNPVNDAPVAVADAFTTDFETLLSASVIANDTDPENDSLSVTLVESTQSGSLNLAGEGAFTYQPNPGYSGTDSFTYLLSDGSLTSATVTSTITIAEEGTPNVNPDLLVQLTMDDSQTPVTDSSGNGNNGVISGGVQYADETGDSSFKSLQFNGTNSSVNVGPVDVAGSGLTMAAWINAESFPGGANDPRIISKASGTRANEHIFMLGPILSGGETRLRARIRIGNVTTTVITPGGFGLNTNQWYHVAATYDGSFVRLYIDGVQINQRALTGAVSNDPTIDVAVGSQPGGGKHFDGYIDDVRLLQRALTSDEVAYAAGDDSAFLPIIPTVPADIAAMALADNRVDLTWVASRDNTGISSYEILRDSVVVDSVAGNITNWSDTSLLSGLANVVYEVVAIDFDGNRSPAASIQIATVNSGSGLWWDNSWPYRALIGVDSGAWPREDRVVETAMNFDQLILDAGGTEAFEAATLRCHEVNAAGEIIAADIYCQAPNADNLSLLMTGATPANTLRYFHAYFDTIGGAGSPSSLPPLLTTATGVVDEGQTSVQLTSSSTELFYHLDGAGFSSALDSDGLDWISFNNDIAGVLGTLRGIPNMVPPAQGGHFHPGNDTATTTIDEQGPIKTTLLSTTNDGQWAVKWDIYPHSATMTVNQIAGNHWFLYEGTPGGTLDAGDSTVRSGGSASELSAFTFWTGDIANDEWVMVTASEANRSMYFAQHEDDQAGDSYRPASATQGNMTVMGFGRTNSEANLTAAGNRFTFGFIESQDFELAKSIIDSTTKPIGSATSTPAAAP